MIPTYTLQSEPARLSRERTSRRAFTVRLDTQPRAIWLGRHSHLLIEVPAGGGDVFLAEGLSGSLSSLYVRQGQTVIFDDDVEEYIFLSTNSAPLEIRIIVW